MFPWSKPHVCSETVALKELSLKLNPGEVLVLLGPNGSGKTTALKLISTMLLPDRGSVSIAGFDTRHNAREVRRRVGFAVAMERSFFPRLSARENLDFFAALDEVPRGERTNRITDVLRETGLEGQADTLVRGFSSGMYQRLGIARALVKRPSILLLDEPTRSVDAAAAARFWKAIRKTADDVTIVLATHNFAEAVATGDRMLLLKRGEVLVDRRLGCESADELRALYFRQTEELDESVPLAARSAV